MAVTRNGEKLNIFKDVENIEELMAKAKALLKRSKNVIVFLQYKVEIEKPDFFRIHHINCEAQINTEDEVEKALKTLDSMYGGLRIYDFDVYEGVLEELDKPVLKNREELLRKVKELATYIENKAKSLLPQELREKPVIVTTAPLILKALTSKNGIQILISICDDYYNMDEALIDYLFEEFLKPADKIIGLSVTLDQRLEKPLTIAEVREERGTVVVEYEEFIIR